MNEFIFAIGDRILLALQTFSKWAEIDFWEAMFVTLVVFAAVVLYRLHRSNAAHEFRVEQFVSDDVTGHASIKKLLGLGAFGISSWILARYSVYTVPLDREFISLFTIYLFFWAGVLMLGKGVERLLDTIAITVAKKFGVDVPKVP